MKVYISLNGHANKVSLPLRFGLSLSEPHQQYAELVNAQFDEASTAAQRPDEIDKQRKHYTGDLVISCPTGADVEGARIDCRVVIEPPRNPVGCSSVITVLSRTSTPGDATVTRHLDGMLKKGRITQEDLLNVFHPAYVSGQIKDSTDCEDVFRARLERSEVQVSPRDEIGRALVEGSEAVVELVEEVAQGDVEDLITGPTFSKEEIPLKGVKYRYVFAEAFIESVWRSAGKIFVKTIGSSGQLVELQSFDMRPHLREHHERTYSYLKDRVGQRGIFAVCVSTPYRGVIAESVTSIALQLMKTSRACTYRQPVSGFQAPKGSWEGMAADLYFDNEPSLMSDDEYEMIYGHER